MSLLNDTMVIYNQKPLWVIVLIYCLTVFVCFLSCSYNYRRLSIYSSVRTEDSTTAALCQMSIRLETPPLTFPFRWGALWQVKLRMHMLCTDFFKFVGFHQTPFQNSELDTSRTTRHHGLVDRVYRERNRITSPHCRPLSVDKHGRQISLMSLLMKADKCFDLCGLRKHMFHMSAIHLSWHYEVLNVESHIDSCPYASVYLSPPPDTSWRRWEFIITVCLHVLKTVHMCWSSSCWNSMSVRILHSQHLHNLF